jgi:hypothetical protein
MTGLLTLRNLLWLITTSAEIFLLFSLLRRKLQTTHAAFAVYLISTIVQSVVAAFIYTREGVNAAVVFYIIWLSQGVVICLRFAAVVEMARRILASYQGLWSLAKRLLAFVALAIGGYSLLLSKKEIYMLVLNLDRGLELAIAAFVVSLLLFARFYLLPVCPLDRALAIGFSLYSCFYVINDTLFERLLNSYLGLWGYLDILTFLASLLIWSHAVRAYSEVTAVRRRPESAPAAPYGALSPELNIRLKLLNEQISRLLHAEKGRS